MRLARLLALVLLAMALALPARAQVIEVKQIALEPSGEGYLLSADFAFDLTARLEEALNNGVPLGFVVEFELTRPRWYWFDEKTASGRLEARLSYNPLLRQYRVSTGPLQRNYSALADAMNALEQVRGWPVLDRDRVRADTAYVASVRMRLDTAQLPNPFQITALTDREWSLASPWKRMPFTPAEGERLPR
jgi:Domain of unknown function (DUF4390)